MDNFIMSAGGNDYDNIMLSIADIQKALVERMKIMAERQEKAEERMDMLELKFDSSEITNQQAKRIRNEVYKMVCQYLKIPYATTQRTDQQRLIASKYSKAFHMRCYNEVSKMGHLASPYRETKKSDFVQAMRDIEAWYPIGGPKGLIAEIDRNAEARRIAKNAGY